jgi:hypothetical protein
VLAVHSVPYLLQVPYWLDEAWVAMSTRVSLGHLTTVTVTTPIGWAFLLRLMPSTGQQDQRLLPLLFAGLTVLAAYGFARTLRLLPVVTGLLAGGAALLVPTILVRDDLKQYTADAFVTVLIFALLSRLEAKWSRQRLAMLTGVLVASALVSQVTFFVAAAAFFCLGAVQLVRRRWAELAETVVAAAVGAVLLGGFFLAFDRGTQTKTLTDYWNAYYLPRHPTAAIHYINTRVHQLLPYFGIRHAVLLVALVVVGLATLGWRRRWATAALLPALAVVMLVVSALHKYPLLDERTSTFLITATVVVAAVGVAGVATLLARKVHLAAGIALAAAAATVYILTALPFVNGHPLPFEDVRAQTAFVTMHASPGDVVLVSLGASYGYGYYAPSRPNVVGKGGVGFTVTYPAAARTVALAKRGPVDVRSGLARALSLVAGHPGQRLWIVLNHVAPAEQTAWNAALAPLSPHSILVAPGTYVRYVAIGSPLDPAVAKDRGPGRTSAGPVPDVGVAKR